MSATGLKTFDSTLQTTNIWLDEVLNELGWRDRHRAYHAMRAVLHTLRDRLPVNEGAHFAAQLPMLVRGFYFEGWHPADKPQKFDRSRFLAHVAEQFERDPLTDPEEVVRAVFKVVSQHVTPGEVANVRQCLPADIQEMWPT